MIWWPGRRPNSQTRSSATSSFTASWSRTRISNSNRPMYKINLLIQGFPGRAVCHGGLGWSTVTLLRGGGRTILLDVGAFGVRRELLKQLQDQDVKPEEVTDVV